MKYKLFCNNCLLTFDSWFSSSDEYEKLKKKKLLNCHNCNSKNVKKTLMSPKLISKKLDRSSEQSSKNFKRLKKNFEEYQKIVEKNFDYVGENFAYEARSIHYKESKRDKGIYGTASKKDLIELKEEGIETQIVPWIQNKNN